MRRAIRYRAKRTALCDIRSVLIFILALACGAVLWHFCASEWAKAMVSAALTSGDDITANWKPVQGFDSPVSFPNADSTSPAVRR